jgi:hypothetical protein
MLKVGHIETLKKKARGAETIFSDATNNVRPMPQQLEAGVAFPSPDNHNPNRI